MKVLNPGKLKRLNVPREEEKNSTLPKTMPQAAGKKLKKVNKVQKVQNRKAKRHKKKKKRREEEEFHPP